jgi:hypothetical protein
MLALNPMHAWIKHDEGVCGEKLKPNPLGRKPNSNPVARKLAFFLHGYV